MSRPGTRPHWIEIRNQIWLLDARGLSKPAIATCVGCDLGAVRAAINEINVFRREHALALKQRQRESQRKTREKRRAMREAEKERVRAMIAAERERERTALREIARAEKKAASRREPPADPATTVMNWWRAGRDTSDIGRLLGMTEAAVTKLMHTAKDKAHLAAKARDYRRRRALAAA